MKTRNVLVTGAAGFIGSHLSRALATAGWSVTGCDLFNPKDPWLTLRQRRVEALLSPVGVPCLRVNLEDPGQVQGLFGLRRFDTVIHLAARAGVRDSVSQPLSCVGPNLLAFAHVIEQCRTMSVPHLLYASSSSVYGARTDAPFIESQRCDEPASFYAATKRCNELMAAAYQAVHGVRATGLRFFTVYGPWGRPDMACWRFSQALLEGQPLLLYGNGQLRRDFTYIDDVIDAVVRLADRGPEPELSVPDVLNVGHRHPVTVDEFVSCLERAFSVRAQRVLAPMQAGDVPLTCADPSLLMQRIGDWRHTSLEHGLSTFARWMVTEQISTGRVAA